MLRIVFCRTYYVVKSIQHATCEVQAAFGEDGRQEFRAVVNTSLSETVAAKFFATSVQSDGWIPNITIGGNNGEEDYQALEQRSYLLQMKDLKLF